jgi:hypothetical protein
MSLGQGTIPSLKGITQKVLYHSNPAQRLQFDLKPNDFKRLSSLSSFLLTYDNNIGPNWPGVLSRLVPCI